MYDLVSIPALAHLTSLQAAETSSETTDLCKFVMPYAQCKRVYIDARMDVTMYASERAEQIWTNQQHC